MMVLSMLMKLKRRARLGYKFLRSFRGASLKSFIILYLSILIDILLYVFSSTSFNPRILGSGIFIIRQYKIYVFSRSFSDDLYYCLPYRERLVEKLIKSLLKEGDIFVDVGANIGYYSLLASRYVGERGLVLAFEPVPETYEVLLMNLKLNNVKNVKAYRLAIWSKQAKIRMIIPKGWFGLASIYSTKQSLYRGMKSMNSITVHSLPLDNILKHYRRIKLVKIDAEGSEYHILKGSTKVLHKIQYIIIELTLNAKETIKLLRKMGFKIKRLGNTNYIFAYRYKKR